MLNLFRLRLIANSFTKNIFFGTIWFIILTTSTPVLAQNVSTVIIPYLETGYKYKVVPFGNYMGFELPGFDDDDFFTGDAGFGTQNGICALNNPAYVKTTWQLWTDIIIRKEFYLPPGASNLKVNVAIDNNVQVFINGYDISAGFQNHEGCPIRDSFVFTAPDDTLLAGNTNLIAIRGQDHGVYSYLDVKVTAEIPEKITLPIDIKPQSCPNPINTRSNGILPVAIIGTHDFDVTQIDPSSISLAGIAPLRSSFKDIATPFELLTGKTDKLDCTEEGPDGFIDLSLKFDSQKIIEALEYTYGSIENKDIIVLPLECKLLNGTTAIGEDVVIILNNGPIKNEHRTLDLQPDSIIGKDAVFGLIVPNRNNAEGEDLHLYAWTQGGRLNVNRFAIDFDISSIPTGAIIDSAYLSLYFNNTSVYGTKHIGENDFLIQRITSQWNEYTITWNTQPSSTTNNQIFISKSTSPTQDFINMNVTNLVQDMIDDKANSHGFLFKLQNENPYTILLLASSDHHDEGLRPRLVINYTVN